MPHHTPGTDGAAEQKVSKLYKALCQIEHASQRYAECGFTAPLRGAGVSLQYHAEQLTNYFTIYARRAVYAGSESQEWRAYDGYCIRQLEAAVKTKARTARNSDLKQQRAAVHQWVGYFRTVYNFVFVYTSSLRRTTHPETKQLWTDSERTTEAQRQCPRASLALAGGFLDDESLRTIKHPAAKKSATEFAWKAPKCGFIEVPKQPHTTMSGAA